MELDRIGLHRLASALLRLTMNRNDWSMIHLMSNSTSAWLATVLTTGAVLGFGPNLSHELGHKQVWLGRKIALFNTALGGYGHFSIEHNRGHHRHVSTP